MSTLAQVTILRFVSSNPASGSVPTAQSLEPASDSGSPSLSFCPSPTHALCLSLSLSLSKTHKPKQKRENIIKILTGCEKLDKFSSEGVLKNKNLTE